MKILAVDDDPFILELLDSLVSFMDGHDLLTATDAMHASQVIAQTDDIDCFLVDIQMPGRDGIDLCREIRQNPRYARAPILMLTAMTDKDYIDRAFAAGATDYINKPFEITELTEQLELASRRIAARVGAQERLTQMPSGRYVSETDTPLSLFQPFEIHDVDGVLTLTALENYITKLSRNALYGSSVVGFTLRAADRYFAALSEFDFRSLIVDLAEALSDQLAEHSPLLTYVGNGSFVCILEDGAQLDPAQFIDALNLSIHQMDLHASTGERLHLRMCMGEAVRLFWRPGQQAIACLSQAHTNAECEAQRLERALDLFWNMDQRA
ncbi:response regulator [Loktanella sp. SALINAS62]|uniref:response regulator n=1 Tax=Loktanella sp. SALINAS62 TaxID=2706124 RepID=UPI001B8A9BF7|nr:response regulator [Loktanella sp. SALINAS62]MBS1303885.1 response regulator [Loktanella sp. SALINAS62]